jgi:hypothetical protein
VEGLERPLVKRSALALPHGLGVGYEPEPVEILPQRDLEFGTAARTIVIFNPEQHPPAVLTRNAPDVDRIHDMAQMQVSRRRRSKSRNEAATLRQ